MALFFTQVSRQKREGISALSTIIHEMTLNDYFANKRSMIFSVRATIR